MLPPSEQWDRGFMTNLLAQKLEVFDEWTDEYLDREAGFGGHEVRCWVAAAAAMREAGTFSMEERFYAVVPEWATGMAVVTGRH
jgi:2,3-dihydroxyphenylpropionate 1,2-dioxygenase